MTDGMVVKVGGAALADPAWLARFASAAARARGPLLIVHGGGPEISAVSRALGVPVAWHEGRRITTPAVLEAAAMVLNGLVNKRIVAALVHAGVDAIGLSGIDGGLIRADVAQDGALGRVGVVSAVRAELLQAYRAQGTTVVISPISLAPDGGALNVNADEVAAAIAATLHASELLFLTDVAGVCLDGDTLATLAPTEAATLVARGIATGGMALKLGAAQTALAAGVSTVRIGDLQTLTNAAAGTRLRCTLEAVA